MNAVWVRFRGDVRRRWRAWLGVVVLVGLFGGIVTAAAAGARRPADAYSRFVVANHGAEYLIDDFIPNPEAAVLHPATVAALPAVAEADSFRVFGPVTDVGYNLVGSPPLYGVTWDTEIWNNNGPDAVPAAGAVVRADPDIATAAFIQTGIDFRLGGHVLSGFAYTPVKGTFAASMLAGRIPAAADEVALGASTAAQLGVRPGATLLGNAENEGAPQVPMRVVGTAVLPPGDVSAHLGDGVIVTRQALVRLAGGRARSPYVIAVTFRPGVDTVRGVARLDRRLSAVDENFFTQPPTAPTDLVNFGRIQNLPLILASVLAVLALITVAHLLATSIRRRRRDLAILKTLGFTHGDVGRAVAWQATILAVVTLAVGVPLGIAAGRAAWRLFAGHLGVVPEVTTPVVLLVLAATATVLLANLISIGPAVTAMLIRPASVLREE